ncbi:PREDICTED: protein ENHANCED DISEASE RESISTANCE 2-like isoform X3 [Tarenaya hassleriana]|uniref:protein ENHANCED DISEASE RESISTANCE 2-like isoform X3 n=1 Tax=Tarenaya hassleriana TaxID=28532 RepID=UPI00053C0C9C|nr:PREDICTED: protein ENHANCED DISEASE RESISTANCE 2-like isoform X3 [Tarenaya hassleriana]
MDNSNYIVACFWVRMPSKPVNKSSSMGVTCTGIRDLSRFQALFSSKDPCGKEKTIRIHAVGSPSGMGFMIRGRTYLKDNAKVMGGEPLLKLIAVDWLNVDKAVDHIALHPNCLVQSEAGKKLPFILVTNLQIPAKPNCCLVLYSAAGRPVNKS